MLSKVICNLIGILFYNCGALLEVEKELKCLRRQNLLQGTLGRANIQSQEVGDWYWHKTPQNQVLSTKDIFLTRGDKGQGMRDKGRR